VTTPRPVSVKNKAGTVISGAGVSVICHFLDAAVLAIDIQLAI
jgi:hypothetical protein